MLLQVNFVNFCYSGTRELAVSITAKISKLLYGNMYQDATFEELGHLENVLLAKEILKFF